MTQHLRSNAIAYLALFVALGGTAFAASKVTSGDIKDNTIKGKDIGTGQVAGSDLRDNSATGDDVADSSLDGGDVEDGGLTGADIADKSIGGAKVDPLTKVPNADMLDGHGSTRYGVGLQSGAALDLPSSSSQERFPVGLSTGPAVRAISPEVLEIRDFTASSPDLQAGETVTVELIGGSPGTICTFEGNQVCHLPSNVQHAIAGQDDWALRFVTSVLAAPRDVTFSYRAVR